MSPQGPTLESLIQSSISAKSKAYCPYSKYRVGCAILIDLNGKKEVVIGANVENASYPVGTCAERVALGAGVVNFGVRGPWAIAISSDSEVPASPCGMCRQFLREF
ncbi:cytidine deaminase-like protein, partial [Piedraia hortae CBS 480.64]